MKLIEKFQTGETYYQHRTVGILETLCYPAKYYVGYVSESLGCVGWFNTYNDTHNYHRTLKNAYEHYNDIKLRLGK